MSKELPDKGEKRAKKEAAAPEPVIEPAKPEPVPYIERPSDRKRDPSLPGRRY